METLIYFLTVFPIGLTLLYFAIRYDYKHVPTVKMELLAPFQHLFKEAKKFTNE